MPITIRTARTDRGVCADPECGKPVKPGDRYSQATRYARPGEPATAGIGQNRVSIVIHEGCEHPATRANPGRIKTHNEKDLDSLWQICVDGKVPGPGKARVTCPRCQGEGCKPPLDN